MIFINEYTGKKYKSAEECEKSEKEYVEAQKKAEEKKRADKAKREAEAKEKKEQVQAAYKKAIDATDAAVKALEEYVDVVEKTGYRVNGAVNLNNLMNLLFEI